MVQPHAGAPVELVTFTRFTPLRHGVSTRQGGVSGPPFESLNLGYSTPDSEDDVTENRRRFLLALNADPATLMVAHLTHGNAVAVFKAGEEATWSRACVPIRPGSSRRAWVYETDGVVSDASGYTFLLTAADCTPLLFWDPTRRVIGAAHAGWRGTARGIAVKVVNSMVAEFGCDPHDIVVGIGPSIGPCCYTVGEEVMRTFAESNLEPAVVPDEHGTRLDLWESNRKQLRAAGLHDDNIETSGLCTACNLSRFYSHRAEAGRTGRMAVAIGLG